MISVERLEVYSYDDAVDLGKLRPYLSRGASDHPVSEANLQGIIDSPHHEQLAARIEGSRRIVGAATLSIIAGPLIGNKGWLEEFVTDPTIGIKGIGQAIWREMGIWCIENGVELEFTSRPEREAAHHFYRKQNAIVYPTTVFKKRFTTPQ